MKKPLLDVIFASDKRKNVLMLLQDDHQEMEYLIKSLDTTRQALLPQVKILEDYSLVFHYDDIYELSTIGKLVTDKVRPLIDNIEVLDADIDYWGTHKLDFLPPNLLESIAAIKNYEIVSPPFTEMYEVHKTFQIGEKVPKFIYVITPFLYPNYYELFSEMLGRHVDLYFIITEELFDKIKISHRTGFEEFIKNKYLHLFMYNKKLDFLFLVVDDFHLLMGLFKQNGDYDTKYLLCSNANAVHWGKELFEHYLKESTPIHKI